MMPMRESRSVDVVLTIHVDGHRLEFDARGKASGARYHGKPAPDHYVDSVLEHAIRDAVGEAVAQVGDRAVELLARMYPYAGEPGSVPE